MASKPTRDAGPRYSRLVHPSADAIVVDRIGRGASDAYTMLEARSLRDWLNDREAGYPSLRRFEGGANWPIGDVSPLALDCNGERAGLDQFAPCCRKPVRRA